MRWLPAIVVVALVVTAGCAGFGGSDRDARTVVPRLEGTPSATPTPAGGADGPLPPGVTPGAADEVDERALSVAHHRALANRSVTIRERQTLTSANGTVFGWYTVTARTTGSRQRFAFVNGGANPEAVGMVQWERTYWTDGNVTVSRRTLADGTVERRVVEGGPSSAFGDAESVRSGRHTVEAAASDIQYVGVETRSGSDLHVLVGTANDSRLTLRVTSEGVVRSLVYRTDGRTNGRNVTLVARFRAFDVGNTTVERPPWAANATG